jgi:hypothetical protein
MGEYTLSHLSDETLLHDLAALVARDRTTTAELLAHISEVDARRLWVPAGHPSMQAYCVEELHLSEDCARKRIHAANVARRIPAVPPGARGWTAALERCDSARALAQPGERE